MVKSNAGMNEKHRPAGPVPDYDNDPHIGIKTGMTPKATPEEIAKAKLTLIKACISLGILLMILGLTLRCIAAYIAVL